MDLDIRKGESFWERIHSRFLAPILSHTTYHSVPNDEQEAEAEAEVEAEVEEDDERERTAQLLDEHASGRRRGHGGRGRGHGQSRGGFRHFWRGFCAAIVLQALVVGTVVVVTWCLTVAAKASSHPPAVGSPGIVSGLRYTIVIPTIDRDESLHKTVAHYTQCPSVDQVLVVWDNPDKPAPELPSRMQDVPVRVLLFGEDKARSLNNRFDLTGVDTTDAILSLDDDVLISCADVEFAFGVWVNSPDLLVGWVPRLVLVDEVGRFMYTSNLQLVDSFAQYSLILTKCAFLHRKYLDMYTTNMDPRIKQLIDSKHNCEDIAMNFLIAHETGLGPVWVNTPQADLKAHQSGISTRNADLHLRKRHECINAFVAYYGHSPLVKSNVVASPLHEHGLF